MNLIPVESGRRHRIAHRRLIMNRREMIEGALAAVVCAAAPSSHADVNDWILIADGSVNDWGRCYSLESLSTMATSSKGFQVTKIPPQGSDEMGSLLGVVSDSKLAGEKVLIRVQWFTGRRPKSGFLTPWGLGRFAEGANIPTVSAYTLQRIVYGSYSSFSEATPL